MRRYLPAGLLLIVSLALVSSASTPSAMNSARADATEPSLDPHEQFQVIFRTELQSLADKPMERKKRLPPGWYGDYDAALAQAKKTGQPLLVVFH